MREGKPSKTAMFVAAYRGRASASSAPLFTDPWAAELGGEEGLRLAEAYDRLHPAAELYFAVRTAYLDAQIQRLARPSGEAAQVVMLGAGLDTRPARLAAEGRRYFEVDHPSTQADKLRRLSGVPGYPVGAATYVPCDFEREDFVEKLAEAGFQASEPALFIWEGVVYYLTEQAVRATLRRIATGVSERAVVMFDFLEKRIVEGSARDDERAIRASYEEVGEPLRFGCNDMIPLLFEAGYRHVRVSSFDEACLHLTGTYERSRMFRFQHLALASRAPVVEP